jgi:Pyruvate/2-oxoacid:ferredoxin oxidoreductase delta subunit
VSSSPTILYCNCTYGGAVTLDVREAVMEGLAASGVPFEPVADLCELAARRDPSLQRLARAGDLHVIACYPRAVRWLFAYAGAPLADGAVIHNMREQSADEILTHLAPREDTGGESETPRRPSQTATPTFPDRPPGQWIAWYPVIDYDRCRNCKQCLEFCLFGAFALDDAGTVRVAAPDRCKLNCPACARVCPASAIIFPKFREGGPIAGNEGVLTESAEEGIKADIKRLSKGDVMDVLRKRAARARADAAAKHATEQPDR